MSDNSKAGKNDSKGGAKTPGDVLDAPLSAEEAGAARSQALGWIQRIAETRKLLDTRAALIQWVREEAIKPGALERAAMFCQTIEADWLEANGAGSRDAKRARSTALVDEYAWLAAEGCEDPRVALWRAAGGFGAISGPAAQSGPGRLGEARAHAAFAALADAKRKAEAASEEAFGSFGGMLQEEASQTQKPVGLSRKQAAKATEGRAWELVAAAAERQLDEISGLGRDGAEPEEAWGPRAREALLRVWRREGVEPSREAVSWWGFWPRRERLERAEGLPPAEAHRVWGTWMENWRRVLKAGALEEFGAQRPEGERFAAQAAACWLIERGAPATLGAPPWSESLGRLRSWGQRMAGPEQSIFMALAGWSAQGAASSFLAARAARSLLARPSWREASWAGCLAEALERDAGKLAEALWAARPSGEAGCALKIWREGPAAFWLDAATKGAEGKKEKVARVARWLGERGCAAPARATEPAWAQWPPTETPEQSLVAKIAEIEPETWEEFCAITEAAQIEQAASEATGASEKSAKRSDAAAQKNNAMRL
jgi:hypothetical protein